MSNPYVTGPPLPRHRCSRTEDHLQHIERMEGPEPEFLCDGTPGLSRQQVQELLAAHHNPQGEPMTDQPETPGTVSNGLDPQTEGITQPNPSEGLQEPPSVSGQRPATNLVAGVERAVAAAAYRHGQGEHVEYGCAMTVIADENNRMQPMVAIFLAIPGLVFGERAHGTTLMNIWVDSADVDETVRSILESCREYRSKQAAEINGQAPG